MKLSDFFYRLTHWETWHHLAKYIPLSPAWLWYCLRSGSLWFFTPSNPTLTFGGFEGESKREMYEQLPPSSYPRSIYIKPGLPVAELHQLVTSNNFTYPFAVKPDVGMKGYMFRIIGGASHLEEYHAVMPVDYIIQELIDYPVEVSVFYYRFPGEECGTITGFLKKEYLEVVGDGKSTLLQLIETDDRARYRIEELKSKHAENINDIIPDNKIYRLSSALNLNRGSRLISLAQEKNERLLKVFDELSLYSKHFYYGRYDIKCQSVEDLQNGRNYSILEFNGSGAEPHHIYGNGLTVFQAYGVVLRHWNVLYKISRYNYNKGIRYWETRRGFKFLSDAKKHFKMLGELDASFRE